MDTKISNELLDFFKALADENRLKIVGLLAQQPCTVEQIAGALGLSDSTISHHLGRLFKARLVHATPDGHYYRYSLRTEVIKEMSEKMQQSENLPKVNLGTPQEAFEKKVMSAFVRPDGTLRRDFPAQEKKYLVLLRYVVKAFEPGKKYTEKQVNEILLRYHEDTAMLRRSLVEFRFMAREGGGGCYWLLSEDEWKKSE